jgi:hypothetical protein
LAPFRYILLDIHIIHQFTANFGLWYLLFANGTLFSIIPGKRPNIHIKQSWAYITLSKVISYFIRHVLTNRISINRWCVILPKYRLHFELSFMNYLSVGSCSTRFICIYLLNLGFFPKLQIWSKIILMLFIRTRLSYFCNHSPYKMLSIWIDTYSFTSTIAFSKICVTCLYQWNQNRTNEL